MVLTLEGVVLHAGDGHDVKVRVIGSREADVHPVVFHDPPQGATFSPDDPRVDSPVDAHFQTDHVLLYEGRKEMVYLTTHSTHFIYGYMEREREREREREMFYLTTHSTHFIYGYMEREREREMFYLTMHSTHFIYRYMEREREMFYLMMHSTHFILRLYGVTTYGKGPFR